ncbi:hypothetical protein ERICI_02497 [Paenibacillus larvae subsp. larvae]|nr:hypothetical protein ERICI_02497 [Paenibacillus larvae subsp. larvae]
MRVGNKGASRLSEQVMKVLEAVLIIFGLDLFLKK